MANPRVHEIASEIGVDSKVALAKLKELGEYVKSPSSTIAPPVARKLRAALEACERYYQAFQFVVWAGKTAADALSHVMFETVGEA